MEDENPKESLWPMEFQCLLIHETSKPALYEKQLKKINANLSSDKTSYPLLLEQLAFLFRLGIQCLTPIQTKEIHYYHSDKGVWMKGAEDMIEKLCRHEHFKISIRGISEIIAKIKSSTLVDISIFDNKPLIALKNGTFNLETYELQEYNHKDYLTRYLDVRYDIEKDCPTIKAFMSEVTNKENCRILEEAVGYCLWPTYQYMRAFMLFGPTHTGKSTFLNLLRTFLHTDNVVDLTLQQLIKRRFGVHKLKGKLALISPDLPNRMIYNTGIFKALTGGDTVDAEVIYKGSIDFKNIAKLWFSCNTIPPTKGDETDAYYTRWIILDFAKQFLQNPNENLLSEITTESELSGFFNLAIAGLRRLKIRGKFEYHIDPEAKRTAYHMGSDSVKAFVHIKCNQGPLLWVEKKAFHRAYMKFCKELGRTPVVYNAFTRNLKKWVAELETTRMTIDIDRVNVYQGVDLKKKYKDLLQY